MNRSGSAASVLVITIIGMIPAVAATVQPPVVIADGDLFDGLAPDSRVLEFLAAPKDSETYGPCSSTEGSSSKSESDGWIKSAFDWVEAHLLAVQTVFAFNQCDPFCTGHYQGPEWVGGCGNCGLCGYYCVSDPTQFDYADGCIDCTIDDPGNTCDGCQRDRFCNNPASPPPPSKDEDQTHPASDS